MVKFLLAVLVLLMAVFWFSGWYSQQVSLPRYCDQLTESLQLLNAINTQSRPAGDSSRRQYIIAAKLEFLLPRAAEEPVETYLRRLQTQLQRHCRSIRQ